MYVVDPCKISNVFRLFFFLKTQAAGIILEQVHAEQEHKFAPSAVEEAAHEIKTL
jgi:hypothetical protein